MNTKKLLIVGGGYADIPLIKAAKALGYYVITSGNRASDLGHQESDEYYPADFSDVDAMLKVAKHLKIDAICPCANDFSAISAAYVAEKLGLPGHDSYETCQYLHHKDSYRRFALEHGIPTPQAISFTESHSALESLDKLNFPLLVKPVDLSGGKGISKIDTVDEASEALELAFSSSKAKRVVVEEFITGTRHGCSSFIKDGKLVFYFLDNEHYYLNQYLVSAASTPAKVPDNAVDALSKQIEKIASLLNLKDGIFHVQYILHEDKPVIIEICRRPPGDLYIQLVEYATGAPYASWIVNSFAGVDDPSIGQASTNGFYTRHCIMGNKHGYVQDILIDSTVKDNLIHEFVWWEKGQLITDYMKEKFGIVFLKFNSFEEMLNKTENLQSLIKVEITDS